MVEVKENFELPIWGTGQKIDNLEFGIHLTWSPEFSENFRVITMAR